MLERPLTCPTLIGRAEALQAITSALESARSGRGQLLLLAGEAGIGKSRLAREARAQAAAAGMVVLQGNCFESDRALPYAPLLDLLRAFCRGRSPAEIREAFGPWSAHLARLLPELTAWLPGGTPPPLAAGEEQRQLFHAVTQFISRLAATRPLLLIVEDLHFADDSSLDALLYVVRRVTDEPVLTLMTYRRDEIEPGFGRFLAQLDRERLALRLRLEPLDASEVAAMLQATLDLPRPAPAGAAQALYALTEGNPFFVEEVLRSLPAVDAGALTGPAWDWQGADAPSIQDAVQRRAERLSAGTRQVLTLAAIAGRRFDFALLQDLAQLDEAALLAMMKEAIAAQLVVEESPEVFAFRHELTRRAILADLLARERRALHARVAEALARRPDASLADLAYHAYQAEDWPRTLDYARRAGEQALAIYAPRAAAEQFTRALEAAGRLSAPSDSHLHAARGHAYETLGEFERARQDYEAAWQAAQAGGDRRAAWEALEALGFLWSGRSYTAAADYFRQALALAQAIGDPALQAHSFNRIGNWHVNQEQPAEAAHYHREAQAIFAGIGDRAGQAETLELLGLASHFGGDQLQAARYFAEAAALFRQLGDHRGLVSVLAESAVTGSQYMTDTTVTASPDLAGALEGVAEALKLTAEMGWQAGEAMVRFLLAYRLGWHGYYGRALAYAERALAIAQEIEHRQWMAAAHIVQGMLRLDLLALPEARRHLEAAQTLARESGSRLFLSELAGSLATVYVRQRDYATAGTLLESVLGGRPVPLTLGQRNALAASVELALARRDPGQALELTDRLIASAGNTAQAEAAASAQAVAWARAGVIPRLALLRGRALAALGRFDESAESLAAAGEAARSLMGRPLLWRIDLELGKVYRKTGQGSLAARHWQASRATAEELAAEIPDAQERAAFLRQVAALIPHTRPPAPAQPAFGALTAREREVAIMVAEGRSNHEIAEALVLSERTVEGHVSSILSRLGFTSRAQIAAWVGERHLRQQDLQR